MKRKSQVKRTLKETPKGPVAYYFQNGKRISDKKGASKWIKQNYEEINTAPPFRKPILTLQEQRSLSAARVQKNLFSYKGRKIKKIESELLKATGDIPKGTKPGDIRTIVDENGKQRFPDYGTWAQQFDATKNALKTNLALHESKLGGAGFRYRSDHQSIQTLLESIGIIGYDGWKLMVIDGQDVASGKVEGMELLKEYELREMDAAQEDNENVAMMTFTYEVQYDFTTKTVIVDTSLATAQIGTSDPKRRTEKPEPAERRKEKRKKRRKKGSTKPRKRKAKKRKSTKKRNTKRKK